MEDVVTHHPPKRASFSFAFSFSGGGASGIRPPKKLASVAKEAAEPETKPGGRVIENMHSTRDRSVTYFRVNAHTDARRSKRRFKVGRVLVVKRTSTRTDVGG